MSECAKCARLIFPGDEVFLHHGEIVCPRCHPRVETRFAGKHLCDRAARVPSFT